VNPLDWWNSCSPAVNVKELPQSEQVRVLSVNGIDDLRERYRFVDSIESHENELFGARWNEETRSSVAECGGSATQLAIARLHSS
jgi:hypothetical protein